jgi:hypothetical protein
MPTVTAIATNSTQSIRTRDNPSTRLHGFPPSPEPLSPGGEYWSFGSLSLMQSCADVGGGTIEIVPRSLGSFG